MQVEVHYRGLREDPAMSLRAERSVLYALSRFAPRVASLTVTLEAGRVFAGECMSCRLQLVWSSGEVHTAVEDFDRELGVALDSALARLERSVRRRLIGTRSAPGRAPRNRERRRESSRRRWAGERRGWIHAPSAPTPHTSYALSKESSNDTT